MVATSTHTSTQPSTDDDAPSPPGRWSRSRAHELQMCAGCRLAGLMLDYVLTDHRCIFHDREPEFCRWARLAALITSGTGKWGRTSRSADGPAMLASSFYRMAMGADQGTTDCCQGGICLPPGARVSDSATPLAPPGCPPHTGVFGREGEQDGPAPGREGRGHPSTVRRSGPRQAVPARMRTHAEYETNRQLVVGDRTVRYHDGRSPAVAGLAAGTAGRGGGDGSDLRLLASGLLPPTAAPEPDAGQPCPPQRDPRPQDRPQRRGLSRPGRSLRDGDGLVRAGTRYPRATGSHTSPH